MAFSRYSLKEPNEFPGDLLKTLATTGECEPAWEAAALRATEAAAAAAAEVVWTNLAAESIDVYVEGCTRKKDGKTTGKS